MSKEHKQKLVDTMRELILHKSVDKITVKEIVTAANISRQAFYYHFEDIFALMEWGFEQEIKTIADTCSKIEDLKDSLKLFADDVIKNYPEMHRLLNSKLHRETENILYNAVKEYFIIISKKKTDDDFLNNEQFEFLVEFFSRGIASYFMEQCISGKKFDTSLSSKEVFRLIISRIN